jgi:hypothetical protein
MKSAGIAVSLCLLFLMGCQETRQTATDQPLSKNEALVLAVSLANETCFKKFSMSPFDSLTYPIDFTDGRWQWGAFDLKGSDGCSAVVSFDKFGLDRKVDIFLSTDTVTPLRDANQPDED